MVISSFMFFLSLFLLAIELPKLFSDDEQVKIESLKLLSFFSVFYLLYVLLMRKMVIQYKAKHWHFDQVNWKKGPKGKMKVIGKWFDVGE